MGKTLKYKQAVALTSKIVDEMGQDFVYQDGYDTRTHRQCFYVKISDVTPTISDVNLLNYPHNSPKHLTGCLVGRILSEVGVSSGVLAKLCNPISDVSVQNALSDYVKFTPKALKYLRFLQLVQDTGYSWGGSFTYAQEAMTR